VTRGACGAWLLAVLALGCAPAERGPDFPTSASFPAAPRRAPSFVADDSVPSELASHAPELGTQLTPLDSDQARALVSRFFMAVLLESAGDLYPLFASQAWVVSEGSRQPAQQIWRARLAQLDYTTLAGRIVAPPQALRTYTFASAASAVRAGIVPPPMAPGEVVVVATPNLSWSGKTRLFGERLAFRLRPKETEPAYEITEIAEDFRLP
jgi:hypothetical protein